MRTWRVGTVSMGSALLLLGAFLLVATFGQSDLYVLLLSWWPVILIILGLEILLFLFFQRKQESNLKYDVFSILFIGFLGTAAIIFTVVTSLGITDKVSAALSSQEVTNDLPAFEEQISDHIERIVFETNRDDVTIESTADRELHIFGTYRASVSPRNEELLNEASEYVTVKERGDIMYVTLKDLPVDNVLGYTHSSMSARLIVPSDVDLDVLSRGSNVVLRPKTIMADWAVEGAFSTSLYLPENRDLMIEANRVGQLESYDGVKWDVTSGGDDEERSGMESGHIELGDATYQLRFNDAHEVVIYN
ncbi:hypothetical protein [Evansella halocellulosilytica]|uniref:hypothetical protein n=1 Tax=Evansella halocellulosilytica TaxID=2011013 RepID=UPI000BB94199|nr:hypothetical protein [Evansella halocellulosilytica]